MNIRKVLALCLAMIFLCSCSMKSNVEQYAKSCWNTIGIEDIEVDRISVMHYTSRLKLTDEVLDTPMYLELPENGYVILFHSFSIPSFSDSYACFLNQSGKLVFTFDYEEHEKLYEKYYSQFSLSNIEAGELALEYLTNCNYISGMINDSDGEEYTGDLKKNTWYSFSKKQIEWVQS